MDHDFTAEVENVDSQRAEVKVEEIFCPGLWYIDSGTASTHCKQVCLSEISQWQSCRWPQSRICDRRVRKLSVYDLPQDFCALPIHEQAKHSLLQLSIRSPGSTLREELRLVR